MISVHEALTQILETVSPLAGERIGLFEATGRVLAEGVESVRKVPPFTNSAMDGYAVRHDDIQSARGRPARCAVGPGSHSSRCRANQNGRTQDGE